MPAYTFVGAGTAVGNSDSSALNPTKHGSTVPGNLMLGVTASFNDDPAISTPTGWTLLFIDTGGVGPKLAIYGRIADGGANDAPTFDWGGAADSMAVILSYGGDVYTDLATIVAHQNTEEQNSGLLQMRVPDLTITTDNTLLFAVSVKNKTATSDDAANITHAQLTVRVQFFQTGTALQVGVGDLQQTTAANYDGTNFFRDGTGEVSANNGVMLALKTAAASGGANLNTGRLFAGLLRGLLG